jgi:hypothetical protein
MPAGDLAHLRPLAFPVEKRKSGAQAVCNIAQHSSEMSNFDQPSHLSLLHSWHGSSVHLAVLLELPLFF